MEAKHTPMVVAAAREMCRLSSEACGIDNGDNWKIYGHSYLEEAETVLAACGVAELLEALKLARDYVHAELLHRQEAYKGYPHKWAVEQEDLATVDAAISRATGEQDTGRESNG